MIPQAAFFGAALILAAVGAFMNKGKVLVDYAAMLIALGLLIGNLR